MVEFVAKSLFGKRRPPEAAAAALRAWATIRAIGRVAVPFAAVLATVLLPDGASAAPKYVLNVPINQHLVRTSDDDNLCSRQGMSMNSMVLFVPTSRNAVSVYWYRATDRFLQYPGTTGCMVWKRIGS